MVNLHVTLKYNKAKLESLINMLANSYGMLSENNIA